MTDFIDYFRVRKTASGYSVTPILPDLPDKYLQHHVFYLELRRMLQKNLNIADHRLKLKRAAELPQAFVLVLDSEIVFDPLAIFRSPILPLREGKVLHLCSLPYHEYYVQSNRGTAWKKKTYHQGKKSFSDEPLKLTEDTPNQESTSKQSSSIPENSTESLTSS